MKEVGFFTELKNYLAILNAYHFKRLAKVYGMVCGFFLLAGYAFSGFVSTLSQISPDTLAGRGPQVFVLYVFMAFSFSKAFSPFCVPNISWLEFCLPVRVSTRFFGYFFYLLCTHLLLLLASLAVNYYVLFFLVEDFAASALDPLAFVKSFFVDSEGSFSFQGNEFDDYSKNSVFLALLSCLFISKLFFQRLNLLKTLILFLFGMYLVSKFVGLFETESTVGMFFTQNIYFFLFPLLLAAGFWKFKRFQTS